MGQQGGHRLMSSLGASREAQVRGNEGLLAASSQRGGREGTSDLTERARIRSETSTGNVISLPLFYRWANRGSKTLQLIHASNTGLSDSQTVLFILHRVASPKRL